MIDIHGCHTREDCQGGCELYQGREERPEPMQREYEPYVQPVPPAHIQAILDRIRSKS